MSERGGIITRLEGWVRRCAATSPNLSLAVLGFVLLMTPVCLFIVSCAIWDLKSTSPVLAGLFDSDAFGAVALPAMNVIGNVGPIGGVALIAFSASRAYLNYRKREPPFRKRAKSE